MFRYVSILLHISIICNAEDGSGTVVKGNYSPAEGVPLDAPAETKMLVFINFNGVLYSETLSKLQKLEELRFESPKFQEVKPGSLCQPPSLQNLIINQADIEKLKKEHLNNCGHLKQLEISYKDFPIESGAFSELNNLEVFLTAQFNWNKLSKGDFVGLNILKKLSLTTANIESIEPGTFSDLTNLEELVLSNNKLSAVNGEEYNLPNLKVLNVDFNPTTSINIDQLLENLPKLEIVHLSFALLGKEKENEIRKKLEEKGIRLQIA